LKEAAEMVPLVQSINIRQRWNQPLEKISGFCWFSKEPEKGERGLCGDCKTEPSFTGLLPVEMIRLGYRQKPKG